jgi:nicotinate-nucleotide adenylyltransferase
MAALTGTVAVFGGSFNPPHVAHQLLVLYVLETQAVDHLLCVPTFRHPFDKPLAPFADRVEMCQRLVAPLAPRAQVSTLEEELGAVSRTFTLLETLAERHPGARLRLVIGADILRERDKWWRWADIERLAPPIIVGRDGFPGPEGVALPAISSTDVRARLAVGAPVDGMVPRSVLEVIHEKGLYRTP